MEVIKGNLFEKMDTTQNFNIIVHGCNAQHVMGSGFAKELRQRYPEAYMEYMNSALNLGENVFYYHSPNVVIANAITQEYYGNDGKKYVSYDAVHNAFTDINNLCTMYHVEYPDEKIILHFPMIGAALGGGNWNVIEQIIKSTVTDFGTEMKLYIL